jgi:hypothetical protein
VKPVEPNRTQWNRAAPKKKRAVVERPNGNVRRCCLYLPASVGEWMALEAVRRGVSQSALVTELLARAAGFVP